jgi:hypothetical protein
MRLGLRNARATESAERKRSGHRGSCGFLESHGELLFSERAPRA